MFFVILQYNTLTIPDEWGVKSVNTPRRSKTNF